MASPDEPPSLGAVFHEAEARRRALETTPPDAASAAVDAALSLYARVADLVDAVALFSSNEAVDDVPTSALPYLLVHFHVAELVQRAPFDAPPCRARSVARARAAYDAFLARVDAYGLVVPPHDSLLRRYRDDPDAKIAAFRAERALRAKLHFLQSDARYLEGAGDDETVRKLHLTNVAFAVHSTFHSLDSLNRELALLDQASSEPAPSASPPSAHDAASRLDQPLARIFARGRPLLSQAGKPLQPFTLVGSRADLALGVFRPSHNLPTMSIDEYLAEERRRGNILDGGAEPPKQPVDDDDMEAADRATYKAREWDDFKDENPRGSGNTLNMG